MIGRNRYRLESKTPGRDRKCHNATPQSPALNMSKIPGSGILCGEELLCGEKKAVSGERVFWEETVL